MEQRLRAQKLKDKRKAALETRLAKVRERKLKKLKASGELGEETVTDSEQTGEHVIQTSNEENTVEQSVEDKSVDKETKERQKGFPTARSESKPGLPEWAKHKISKWIYVHCFRSVNYTPRKPLQFNDKHNAFFFVLFFDIDNET